MLDIFYVITVKGKWRDEDNWDEYCYEVADDCWYSRIYSSSFINTLEEARKFAAKVECDDDDEFEYDKDSLTIKKIALEPVESVRR